MDAENSLENYIRKQWKKSIKEKFGINSRNKKMLLYTSFPQGVSECQITAEWKSYLEIFAI